MKIPTWQFDGALAAMFAIYGAWLLWDTQAEAADAIRQSGHPPVDAGALAPAFVILFLLPLATLFSAAAIAGARGWRAHRYVHWLAVAATMGLVGVACIDAISR